ncbi:MAG: hypothetical protein QXQ69_00350 [Candidatus Aenigmatarchaeota archaeon]
MSIFVFFLFFVVGILSKSSKIVGKAKKVFKYSQPYDILLVGEVHEYAQDMSFSGPPQLYQKEIEKELYLIEKNKPDYLFLEIDEKGFEEDKEISEKFKKIYELARKVGCKIVPMEEPYSLQNAVKIFEKTISLKMIIQRINEFLFLMIQAKHYLDRGYVDIAEKQLERVRELFYKPIPIYEFERVGRIYLSKLLGVGEVSPENLEKIYGLADKKRKELEEKLEFYENEELRNIYFNEREKHWARLIAKIHANNPKARSMVIVGGAHIDSEYTSFPKLLKEYGLRYKTEMLTKEIEKEREKQMKEAAEQIRQMVKEMTKKIKKLNKEAEEKFQAIRGRQISLILKN